MTRKLTSIEESIVKSFKKQRENLIKSIEGQAEFDIGEIAFEEVDRSLKLLGKQFMLENADNLDNLRVSDICKGTNSRSTLSQVFQ